MVFMDCIQAKSCHSTVVDLCQNDVTADVVADDGVDADDDADADDVFVQLRQLRANHLWLRQQLTQLQRDAFQRRLLQQKILYEGRAVLESKLRQLQHKHSRHWGL
ncbi:hypothetical protein ACLKA7_008250 [Drosophila subpalustris]